MPRNRLASAKSPYLLQHATNPVDWYEWSPEAFARARELDVPIFLSVGYSACHWCHVLAHESFEDKVVAAFMNDNFVNIKVDREERPDVDSMYMGFLQSTTGGGGWPLSVFLTPSLEPFLAGTYYPRARFLALLDQISATWRNKRREVVSSAEDILIQLQHQATQVSSLLVDRLNIQDLADSAASNLFKDLSSRYDQRYGGFSQHGPKFPSPSQSLNFLAAFSVQAPLPNRSADHEEAEQRQRAAQMAVGTLRGIWEGGIRDHVGGGIARYSVDECWHVPHFEKMLYDQAQLAAVALHLSILDNNLLQSLPGPPLLPPRSAPEVRAMLRDMGSSILEYAERNLLDSDPARRAFWSAEDADSKTHFSTLPSEDGKREMLGQSLEGAFYVWESQELDGVLQHEPPLSSQLSAVDLFKLRYGVKLTGNVNPRSDIQGELTGKNVLYEAQSIESLAKTFDIDHMTLLKSLQKSLMTLEAWRNHNRPRPHLDDKVMLGWNGLMISAFALANSTLPKDGTYPLQSRCLSIAENTAAFIKTNMINFEQCKMHRTWRGGHAGPQAQADDYAFFIQGLLDLYEASGEEKHMLLAIQLQEWQDKHFWDTEDGGYFNSVEDPHILIRSKEAQDGAEPSAVSITLSNLSRLAYLDSSKSDIHGEKIIRTISKLAPIVEKYPRALANTVVAMMGRSSGMRQFIVQGSPSSPQVQAYLDIIHRGHPNLNKVTILIDPQNLPFGLAARNEVVQSLVDDVVRRQQSGEAVDENVRVCEGFVCKLPVHGLKEVENLVLGM
ncbi:hypothetical protein DL93DRAFT_2052144 [Clavulina sp. PMI_390]|nr:hypothetical protein DL93DRAFT_2052144 [Clavulina sp. PMI_390]